MAPRQAKGNLPEIRQQSPPLRGKGELPTPRYISSLTNDRLGKQSQGINKEQRRKSARLEVIQRRQKQTGSKEKNTEQKDQFPPSISKTPIDEACHSPPTVL
jgi:hypothetical protein